MTNTANDVPATSSPAGVALSPGEVLAALFLANADRGANAANDVFVEELLKRRRAIQSLVNPSGR
ncbi:MAG TPA: hypothetical protein VFN75_10000 [Pseudonocardiaceae bacterium]|nr:hypothetical protein [Pseudonocardiaceae bacterium]